MKKTYWNYEQDEAYRLGVRDGKVGRTDMTMNRYGDFDSVDRAYFDGISDAQREIESQRRQEENWDNEYERWMRGE